MNILFVCTGNIGRSPLAKAILQKKYKENGISAEVDSAGFETLYINELPDKRILEFGKKVGLEINDKARIFLKEDFHKFDKIYVMDTKAFRDVKELAKDKEQIKQIDYLMNLVEPGKNKTVPDPITSWQIDIKTVYDYLDKATDVIVENAKK
ncbi:MAG: low molecular weight phosphotyrosine protein phosphatase [Bacteroidetes bacterium]|nr:low molecular weight phosphotyrosine protein phosphatase [Bacteroidota bacterium]